VGVWILLVQLPYRVQLYIPHLIIPYLRRNKKRLNQVQVNLKLCFPEFSDAEYEELLYQSLYSIGMAIFETGIAFFWPK
jgi:Kdo2-lipid IVA lauroyltransferase/acyltransferase